MEENNEKKLFTLANVMVVLGVGWGIYHLLAARFFLLAPELHNNLHLILAVTIVFLGSIMDNDRQGIKAKIIFVFDIIFWILMLVCAIYIFANYHALRMLRPFTPTFFDTLVGVLIILSISYYSWRKWGLTITILGLVSLLYVAFGDIFSPGSIFYHSGVNFKRLVAMQTTFFSGVYGDLLSVSANMVVLFIVFGAILNRMGALNLVSGLIRVFAGDSACAAAQLAILGSAGFGSISGASVASAAITGSLTIPMMIKNGMRRETAAAIEATASTGGGITPPIMGATAFLVAQLANVSYFKVVVAAAIPIIIYFGYMMFQVYLYCARFNLLTSKTQHKHKKSDAFKIIGNHTFVVIPFLLLIFLLSQEMPVMLVGLYSIICAFAVRFLHFLFIAKYPLQKAATELWTEFWQGLRDGMETMAPLAIVMACLGIFNEATMGTGIGNRLSFILVEISKGSLYPLLILMAITSVFLGLGLPTIPSYLLVAVLGGPAMMQLGIPLLVGHLFILYYANYSQVTPPVALASLVTSKIAGCSYFKASNESMFWSIPVLFIPMLFVTFPALCGPAYSQGPMDYLIALVAVLYCMVPICISLSGYLVAELNIFERIVILVPTFFIFTKSFIFIAIGAAVFAAILVVNIFRRNSKRNQGAGGPEEPEAVNG